MKLAYICPYVHYKKYHEALQEHSGSFLRRYGTFKEFLWKGKVGVHETGGTSRKKAREDAETGTAVLRPHRPQGEATGRRGQECSGPSEGLRTRAKTPRFATLDSAAMSLAA
jgi:hypothetical protein